MTLVGKKLTISAPAMAFVLWPSGSVAEWLVLWTMKLAAQVRFPVAAELSTNYFSSGW